MNINVAEELKIGARIVCIYLLNLELLNVIFVHSVNSASSEERLYLLASTFEWMTEI